MTEHRIAAAAGSQLGPLYAAVVAAASRVGGTCRTVTDGPTTALIVDDATYREWRAGLPKPAPSTQDTSVPESPAPAAKGRSTRKGK